jgi:uncharacterized protein
MGPLVPDVIGNEFNLIIALVIGILFGVILEQAGFSTSKKLVGLFYGYDFTVLRVFFTAGFTAMIGIIVLDHFGLIDTNLIYINPFFVGPAIIGGIIMGLGFVIGGFCPGTSICAAAIGKIDALYFILGSAIGILIFAEGYPLWEGFFKSGYLGAPQMFDTLGLSQSMFAFLLTAIALLTFWGTSIIENKVNGVKKAAIRFTPYYVALGAIGVIISVSAFMFPPREDYFFEKIEDVAFVNSYPLEEMTIDEFAFKVVNKDHRMVIVDFRQLEEYKKESFPNSRLFSIDNFFEKEPDRMLRIRNNTYVIAAETELQERKMAIIASEIGYKNIKILKGGLETFRKEILNFEWKTPTNKVEETTYRFRENAKVVIPKMIEENKSAGPVKKTLKRVVGGC